MLAFDIDLQTVVDAVKDLGIGQALLVIIVVTFMFFLFRHTKNIYDKLIEAKNEEIKRIVLDNKEFRVMFSTMIVERLEINLPPDE